MTRLNAKARLLALLKFPVRTDSQRGYLVVIANMVIGDRKIGSDCRATVARYIVHGVLHLIGHDDLVPEKRRIMKREENRLVKALSRRFDFSAISR